MTTPISSQLKAQGPFPLIDAKDVIGGFKSGVATLADRDAIPASFRAAGMRVPVLGDDGTGVTGRVYVLGSDLTTWTGLSTQGEIDATAAKSTSAVSKTDLMILDTADATAPDDDSIAPTLPVPALYAFVEKLTKRARSFVMRDGGFAAKTFAFIYMAQPQDDDTSAQWGVMLSDGKMPLQADGEWKFFIKLQDRAVALIATALGMGLKVLWRGPSAAMERRVGDTVMTALIEDATTTPNWYGRISLPRAASYTTVLASSVSKLVMLHYIGQSNSITSGNSNPTIFSTIRFPFHVMKFVAGRNGPINAAVDPATLNDLAPYADDAGNPAYPMTMVAYLAQYWARARGEQAPAYLCRADSNGGIPITQLIKGAAGYYFYANAQQSRIAALALTKLYGLDLEYRIVFVQGEDPTVATDQYQTYLSNNIIDAHTADSITDIGRALSSFVILQTNGLADGTNSQKQGAMAHLAETRRRRGSRVALAGPMYQFAMAAEASSANIHSDTTGRLMHGDLVNYVHREIAARGSFTPLDITRKSAAALAANQGLRGVGLSVATQITALGSGTGDLGTYTVNNSQTVGSSAAPVKMVAFGAVFWGYIAGTTLTVTKIEDGTLDVTISGSTVSVRFNRPVKIDTDWVPSVGVAYGFTWADASGATITSVTVSNDIATLTLSGSPTGAKVLGYAAENCAAPFILAGGATGTNWAATRGQIYNDSGVEASAYVLGGYGTRTVRNYLPRLQETF